MSVFRCRTSPCKSQMFRSGGIWSFSEGGCILSLSLWRSIFRGLHICSSAHQTHWAFWTFRTSTAGQKWTQKQSVINAHKRYQIHYYLFTITKNDIFVMYVIQQNNYTHTNVLLGNRRPIFLRWSLHISCRIVLSYSSSFVFLFKHVSPFLSICNKVDPATFSWPSGRTEPNSK